MLRPAAACRQRSPPVALGTYLLAIQPTDEDGTRILVNEEGRQRGIHDYLDDFDSISFTPECSSAIYDRHGEIWVVELESRRVGVLVQGTWLFFAP